MPIILDIHNGSRYERINISYTAGDPKGDASNPYNWDDLVAFTAGETYKVTKVGDSSYFSEHAIYMGGANTVFEHNDCTVTWLQSNYAHTNSIRVQHGTFKSQNSKYLCEKTTNTPRFLVETEASSIKNLTLKGFYYVNINCDNDQINHEGINYPYINSVRHKNNTYKNIGNGIWVINAPVSFEGGSIFDSTTGIFLDNNAGKSYSLLKNINLINVTAHFQLRLNSTIPSSIHDIQDCNADLNSHSISIQSTSNMTINLTSSFIVKSIGGTAQLYDKNNTLIETVTLINGDTEFTPVKYKSRYLACEGATLTENVLTDYEPFKLVINKDGYKEYVVDNIYVTDESGIGTLYPTVIIAKLVQSTPEITGVLITDCTDAGSNDGSIEVTSTNYYDVEYSLDNVVYQQSNVFSSLSAGVYTVYVKDENGAIDSLSGVKITKPAEVLPQIAGAIIENASAIGESDGSITVTAMAYNMPVEYSLGGAFQLSNVFTGLAAGTYAVTVRDNRGNIDSIAGIQINEPSYEYLPRIILIDITNTTEQGASDGSIELVGAGLNLPLAYSVDGTNYQLDTTFDNLQAGVYTLYVKDSRDNVSVIEGVRISQPKSIYYDAAIEIEIETDYEICI